MRASSSTQTKKSTLGGDRTVAQASVTGIRATQSLVLFQDEIRRLIRTAWPEATHKHLAAACDITVRQAERIMARQKKISINVFWALLESEQFGRRFYIAMQDALTTQWSRAEVEAREVVSIGAEQRALDERKARIQKLMGAT